MNVACVLEAKINCQPTYYIYRTTPNCPDQISTYTKDGVVLYRFASVVMDCCSCPAKYTYSVFKGNGQQIPIARGMQRCGWKFLMQVDNLQGETVTNVGQTSAFQFSGANEYQIVVAPGMDGLAMVAMGIVCDQMNEKNSNN